eukprot:CAMPEP_0176406988 /NCGR_PEP_ID=MMETSP0127-20121128/1172_1 /TAXON_ID=938130 /ORGANISM="Platyophrya macrostoma, Strain WH" /LENGTH=213 /DNA_ID=CAMNT_0017786165 /DNA_START=102 /DNA_END=743 /DNA_ORIENTATION=+
MVALSNNTSPSSAGAPNTDTFKNSVLGLPPEGPKPGSVEAEALHAAEMFISDIRAELDDYDRANAKAVESLGVRWGLWKSSAPVAATSQTATEVDANGNMVERSSGIAASANKDQQLRWFMFKKRNPHTTPLLLRWWVPWLCIGALLAVWTPDTWKLRGLHRADSYYAALRRFIHTQYWRLTMDPAEFDALMKDIEANKARNARSVKASDCPF